MAKELDSIIKIDNEDYSITAEKAKKVANKLNITVDGTAYSFDGSEAREIVLNTPTSLPANGGNADTLGGKSASDFISATQKGAANGIATLGADGKVPASQLPAAQTQNTFSKIAVSGQSDVSADAATDTLTLIAGNNITITTNATNDSITIASTGGGTSSDTEATLTITDKTNTDNANLVYAVTNLVEGGTKGHTITPTYTGLPTKAYVDNAISGFKKITVSQNEPSGGATGDIWFKY